jgi:hypothetical protein
VGVFVDLCIGYLAADSLICVPAVGGLMEFESTKYEVRSCQPLNLELALELALELV